MQFMETTKSTQRALQSVKIQVGELAEAVTQFMSRQEKYFVEIEAQDKIPIKEHESREKDEEKDEEQAQQQREKYSTIENFYRAFILSFNFYKVFFLSGHKLSHCFYQLTNLDFYSLECSLS